MKTSAGWILGVITVVLTAQAQAQNPPNTEIVTWADDNVSYTPAKCQNGDKRKVYFAVGSKVYALPYKTHISMRGMDAKERAKLPKRPAPNEQEGCYDNPMWGGSFSFSITPAQLLSIPQDKDYVDEGLVEKSLHVTLVMSRDGTYNAHTLYEAAFNRVKSTYNNCDNWISSLTACYQRTGSANGKVGPEPVVYQSDKKDYATPNGRSLTISCLAETLSDEKCKTAYQLEKGIGMFYSFDRRVLPARFALEYDKAVREELRKMEVANYQWGL